MSMLSEGQVIERFTVEAQLGEGGMASVFRVRHNALGSLHALKLLKVHGESIRRRLVTEGQVQAALRHPNVVAVTDVVFIGEQPGLVMELVEGPTLEDWLNEYQPTIEEAEALFRGVLSGVSRAHRAGLVHRDLKPGNVLLDNTDGVVVPKVADFGLAKVLDEDESLSMTRSGVAMGTPQYMAPEQIRSAKDVDQRADIWALGCILYQLICGRRPFDSADIIELYALIGRATYPPPQTFVPGLPERYTRAIEGCLVADRQGRIADCDTLRQILGGTSEDVVPGGASRLASSITRAQAARTSRLVPAVTRQPGAALQHAASTMGFGEEGPMEPMAMGRPTEDVSAAEAPPPVAPPPPETLSPPSAPGKARPTAGLPVWIPLLAGLAVALALGAVLLLVLGIREEEAAVSADPAAVTEAPEAPEAPEPSAPAPAPPEPEPEATASTAPPPPEAPPNPASAASTTASPPASTASLPASTAATPTSTERPRRAEPAAAVPMGRVEVTGEVERVTLRSGGRTARPGAVPAGTYTATVTFSGREPIEIESFDVKENETVTLACNATFVRCRVR